MQGGRAVAIIPVFIPHAGCPHQCVFCNQKTISGQQTASSRDVEQQLERYLQWIKQGPSYAAAFYGGSFTGLPADLQTELFRPVDKLLAEGVIGSVRLSTRPDYIDAARLELLQAHGVKTVELGVQSLDDNVLAAAERGHQATDVYKAVSLLKQYGFEIGLQLMVGMPCQSFDSVKATVEQVLRLGPSFARIYPLLVIKGTPLEHIYERGEFEPLTLEDVLSIYEKEQPLGVIAQFGGQTPLNLAAELEKNGVKILGTSPSVIDLAEDRDQFRAMMEKLEIPMPESGMATTVEEALQIAEEIGYPVMVRPSYVLGGRGMEVVYDADSMTEYMKAAVGVTPDRPILIDRFLNEGIFFFLLLYLLDALLQFRNHAVL